MSAFGNKWSGITNVWSLVLVSMQMCPLNNVNDTKLRMPKFWRSSKKSTTCTRPNMWKICFLIKTAQTTVSSDKLAILEFFHKFLPMSQFSSAYHPNTTFALNWLFSPVGKRNYSQLDIFHIYLDTSTYDEIERDVKSSLKISSVLLEEQWDFSLAFPS